MTEKEKKMRPTKKIDVFTVTCLEKKNGSVGRDFYFFFNPNNCNVQSYWLSLCFTSIDVVFIKEKES